MCEECDICLKLNEIRKISELTTVCSVNLSPKITFFVRILDFFLPHQKIKIKNRC